MKFSDLKIGLRLHFEFAVIILLLMAHIVISHFSLEDRYRLLQRVTMKDNRKLQTVSELRDILSKEAVEPRDSIILSNQPDIRKKLAIISASQERFREVRPTL